MIPSPYTPGATPAVLAGRRQQIADVQSELAMVATYARFAGRIRVDTGPRGVGKTSLLKAVRDHAAEAGFVLAWATARPDESLVASLVDRIRAGLDDIGVDVEQTPRLRDRIRTLSLELGAGPAKAGVEVDVASMPSAPTSGAASTALGEFVQDAAAAARERGSAGLCLIIDEIQAAPVTDLRTLAYAWQELQSSQPEPPAVVFAAGLPNAPDVLTDAVTFSERFAYRVLERLDDAETAEALVAPAARHDVSWHAGVLREVVRLTQGYPYYVQIYGDAIWRVAGPGEGGELTADHLERAAPIIAADLQTMFRARWSKATPAERRMLAAMAARGDVPVKRADVATQMGVDSNALSVPRRSLIDKGLIEVPGRGLIAFTIPGFADFVTTETDH